MKITTVKKLQEAFSNKVCTVLTNAVAKSNFPDQQFSDFFTGLVESIDEDGMFVRHTLTGCLNFYAMEHIVGVLEEQFYSEDDPEYQNIIDQIKQKPNTANNIINMDQKNETSFIDPEILAGLSKQAQETSSKMLRKQ